MKGVLIYDSFFGNTEKIAQIIGKELNIEVTNVKEVKLETLKDVDLLIVGSPTRAFQPSPNIKSFLGKLPANSLSGKKVAAFDTGISEEDTPVKILKLGIKYFGYAANKIAKGLVRKGGELVADSLGFWVKDTKGPIKEGEIEKAKDWANKIKSKI